MRASLVRLALALLSIVPGACGSEPQPAATAAPPEPHAPEPPAAPDPPRRPGPICTFHGWCWQHPAPQGNTLRGVLALDGEVIAVGDRGTVIRRRDGAWAFEDTPTRETLRAVWGPDSAHVWAVGERGTILARGDEGWRAAEPLTERALHAIWGRSASELYATGEAGTVLRFDGTSWSREPIETDLTLVAVAGGGDLVYALGVGGHLEEGERQRATLFVRRGGAWAPMESFAADLGALWVGEDGSVIVAGADARHYDGRWTTRSLGIDRPVTALFGAGGRVFAAGYEGRVASWGSGRWSRLETGATRDVLALSGHGGEVWAVGASGLILRFGGERWQAESRGEAAHLNGVWGSGPSDVWAVGEQAMLRFDGREWSASGPREHALHAIGGAGSALLAAGDRGALLELSGDTWTPHALGGEHELHGVWSDGAHAFVVGKSVWLHREGGAWRELPDRPPATGVWGASD